MPPNHPLAPGLKRRRTDEIQPAEAPAPEQNSDAMPQWVKKTIDKTVRDVGNVQTSICKKREGIQKLEQHVLQDSVPKSMQIKMAIMVTDVHQKKMEEVIQAATKTCQDTVLKALIEIRQAELKNLENDLKSIENKWKEEMSTTLLQMKEDNLLDTTDVVTLANSYHDELKSQANAKVNAVRMKDFLARKQRLEKDNERQQGQANKAMETTLKDPETDKLQKRIKALEKKMGTMAKKAEGKPVQHPKTVQSPKPGTKKTPAAKTKKGNPSKGRGESGKGNKNPKNSKPSTNQSAQKKKTSRKKPKPSSN